MSTNYNGRIFTIGDTVYFSKFGTQINGSYASASGTKGTCYGKVTALYSGTYAFPIVIGGTITAGTGGSFTTAAVKPLDCSKGYQVMVIYDKNDGSGTVSSQTGYVGASLTGTMSRAGYQFGGWYTAYSGGSKVTTIPANETRYYAHWNGNTWYVKFNGNGNTGGSTAQQTHTYGSTKALTANGFTRTGYHFNKWNRNSDGSGTSYNDKASVTNLTTTNKGTVNLYAQWTANTYYVKFNGNGATSGSMDKQTYYYGTYQNLRSNTFSKGTGWKFAGWNTKADGTGTSYTNGQSVRNLTSTNGGTVNLYAQWEIQYVAPTISNLTAVRYENDESDDSGTQIHVTFNWSVNTSVVSTNYATSVKIQYKQSSASSWTTLQETTYSSQTSSSKSGSVSYTSATGTANVNNTYDIRATITDKAGNDLSITAPQASVQTFLSKAFFTMDFSSGDPNANPPIAGGEGIGIGLPAPTTGLDIGMRTVFYNQSTVTNESSESQNSSQGGTYLQARVMGITAYSGDNFRILMGVNSAAESAGLWVSNHGVIDNGYWLLREYYNSGTPFIGIGNSEISGIRALGHATNIGAKTNASGTKSVASGTSMVKVADAMTLSAGCFVIVACVQFPDNSTGTRGARLYFDGSASATAYAAYPSGNGVRAMSLTSLNYVADGDTLDVDLYARQNSGSPLTVTWYVQAMRIV